MGPKKLIIRTAGLVNNQLLKTHWPLFFTLTYRDRVEWESKQISNFIKNYREFVKRKFDKNHKLTYIWTAEDNKNRDYIHYHGIIWIPNGILPPMPDTTTRTKKAWWPHGYSNVQRARNPAAYIAKYIGKSSATLNLPKRARTYSINVRHIMDISYLRCPSWLCYFSKFGDKIKRVKGYGWVNFTLNRFYDSPWKCERFGKRIIWRGWPHAPKAAQHFQFVGDESLYAENPDHSYRCHVELTAYDKFLISIGESRRENKESLFDMNPFSPNNLGLQVAY